MKNPQDQQSKDSYSYKGWLVSDHFIKRSFAIFGYYFVANFIITAILLFIGFIFVFTIGGLFLSNAAKHGETYFERGDDGLSFELGTIDEDDQVFCTQDAFRCPDGSYVSRMAPSCEFAPCPEVDGSMGRTVNYNEPFTVSVGEQVMLSNGMLVTLNAIDDQRCQDGVQCIWEGEYRVTLHAINPVDDVRTFTLGSVRETEAEYWGYTFTLNWASDNQIELVIVY